MHRHPGARQWRQSRFRTIFELPLIISRTSDFRRQFNTGRHLGRPYYSVRQEEGARYAGEGARQPRALLLNCEGEPQTLAHISL